MSKTTYVVEEIPASQLQVDPRVQRDGLRINKVMSITNDFNPDALGVISVSRRGSSEGEADFIIDGWHRTEAARRKDGSFPMTCHVFTGLTVADEALMFLHLNTSTTPTRLEKFKVRLAAEDPAAQRIQQITSSLGWTVSPQAANGHINAVGALERIDALSMKLEASPHLLDITLRVITQSWGIERYGAQAVILEGIARVFAEYSSKVTFSTLVEKLRERKGGPAALHANAQQMAAMRNGRTAMAVAELVVETYNKGAKTRQLPRWSKRS